MKKSIVKILLVEDDSLLSSLMAKMLSENNYIVDIANDGEAAVDLATAIEYDLILLDVQIPKLDGISVCKQLRSQGYYKPILLMTGNNSDANVVAGFDAGADDYISKPCAMEVLLARMRTLLRRSKAVSAGGFANHLSANILTWGNLCLDLDAGRVTCGQEGILLTATEYNLLELFLRNPDRIFSRSAILDRLWGFDDAPTDRAIITHIKDIRKKLKAGGLTKEIIETVYGMGYRLKPQPKLVPSSNSPKIDPKDQQLSSGKNTSNIDKVFERFRGVFDRQIAVLEQAKKSLLAGDLTAELQQSAKHEAHKLVGSMGSFGYPEGSKLARSAEHLLMQNFPFSGEEITRFSGLVTGLQQELTKPTVMLTASPSPTVLSQRLLVVDDDIALTECLKAESEAWGLRLKIAPNLIAARSLLALSMPDVMLLDLSFGETEEDGLTLLQEVTKRSPDLPIIVFTGRDSLADRLAVSRLGAKQFLHKPATTEQIFQAISRVLPKPKTLKAKVLIVDDDVLMLVRLSDFLTPWGLEVITLSEPQRFWDVLISVKPDLIVLDIEMPLINGLELCQVVRQDIQWEHLPILVVTAHSDPESLQKAFMAGSDDFITKPVLGPELVTRVISRIERNWLS